MPAEIPSNRSQVSPSDGPPDVQARLNATLEQLDSRQDGWAQAVRQDAVEAVVRLGWMQKVRAGVRVPIHDMYVVPVKRLMTDLVRSFIDDVSVEVSAYLGCSASELVLVGRGVLDELEVTSSQVDPVMKRGWNESELDFRLRFEADVQREVAEVYRSVLRPHLGVQLETVARAWANHARRES